MVTIRTKQNLDGILNSAKMEGDIRIVKCLDEDGARNVAGGYGCYSGNILIWVWDGKRWAWLRNRDKPHLPTHYGTQKESQGLVEDLAMHFITLAFEPQFNYWWYQGKRFAKITNTPEDKSKIRLQGQYPQRVEKEIHTLYNQLANREN